MAPQKLHSMTVREVRMWHHQRFETALSKAKSYEGKEDRHSKSLMRQHAGRASFHMACIRALNAVLPDSTVEQDWARALNYGKQPSNT
jgi:hypothetical protein